MNVLIYRYGSICEPDMIQALKSAGLNVIEECTEIDNKKIDGNERVALLERHFKENDILFVFSINFFPVIAKVCHIYGVKYLCWTVDSPVMELFSDAIKCDTNRIFLFDREQYDMFSKYNPEGVFHLPLASASYRFDKVIENISNVDRKRFSSDISFVGSLYTEKDRYQNVCGLDEYTKGFVEGVCEASMKVYGCYLLPSILPDDIVNTIYDKAKLVLSDAVESIDRYLVSYHVLGYHIAAIERTRTLNALGKHFNVDLYTRSDTSKLVGVKDKGGVKSLTEMPKVFNLSKINLNMTMRTIVQGLPLRIFDILGCGGFLMTNYQPELTDMFEIGVDIEAYSSIDELIDKCDYYLSHDEERIAIARRGYEKVCNNYTYFHRLKSMLGTIV